ncbi:AMIN domain-containing protein, partial [Candidatus Dependentiae bacterium]|nr:AMIN domain-containing protein [Candidatus Dependentiae bacterium]
MNRLFIIFIFILGYLICLPTMAATPSATLQVIEIKQNKNQTTLTFTIQTQATANIFTLKNPDRLVLDLDNTKASQTLPAEIHSNGLIQNIRLGHGPDGPKNLRLVIDLTASAQFVYLIDQNSKKSIETITLILTRDKTTSNNPSSITQKPLYAEALDLEDLNRQNPILTERQAPKQQQDLMEAFSNYTRVKQAKMNKVIVMIDPGHGGKDSGAVGPHRHMEKTVVLAISQKLQQILNATPGINARLTRKG